MRKVNDIIRGITKLTTQLDKAAKHHNAQAAVQGLAAKRAAVRQTSHQLEAKRAAAIRAKVADLVSV